MQHLGEAELAYLQHVFIYRRHCVPDTVPDAILNPQQAGCHLLAPDLIFRHAGGGDHLEGVVK
jgi:hypothetical protein